ALLVGALERVRNLPCDWQRFVQGNSPVSEAIGERRSLDELHDDERILTIRPLRPILLLQPIDMSDMRVVQRGQQVGLTLEAREAIWRGGETAGRALDSPIAM